MLAWKKHIPEDVGDGSVHGKGGWVEIILVPNAFADVVAIVRSMGYVVNRDDDGEEPSQKGEDLVSQNGSFGVRLPLAKGVDCGDGG